MNKNQKIMPNQTNPENSVSETAIVSKLPPASFEDILKVATGLSSSVYYESVFKETLPEIEKNQDIYTYNALDKFINSQTENKQFIFSFPIYAKLITNSVSITEINKTYFNFIKLSFSHITLEMQQSLMSKILINLNNFIYFGSSDLLEPIETYDHTHHKTKNVTKTSECIMSALDNLNAMSLDPQYKELFKSIGESVNPENLSLIKSYNLKYFPAPYNQAFIKAVEASGTNNLSLLKNLNEILKKNSQSAQYLVKDFNGWTDSAHLAVFFENAISKKSVDDFLLYALKKQKIDAQKLSSVDFILNFLKKPNVSQEFKIYFLTQIFDSLNHPALLTPIMTWMQEQIASNHQIQEVFDAPPFSFKDLIENQIKFFSLKDLQKVAKNNSSYSKSIKAYLSKPEGKERIKQEYLDSMRRETNGKNYGINANHPFSNYKAYQEVLGLDFLNEEEKEEILLILFKDSLCQGAEVKLFFEEFVLNPMNKTVTGLGKVEPASEIAHNKFNNLFASLLAISASPTSLKDYPSLAYLIQIIRSVKDKLNQTNLDKINDFFLNPALFDLFVDAINTQSGYYISPEDKSFLNDEFLKSQINSPTPFKYLNDLFRSEEFLNKVWFKHSKDHIIKVFEAFFASFLAEHENLNYVVDLKKDNPIKNLINFCIAADKNSDLTEESKSQAIFFAMRLAQTVSADVFKGQLNHLFFEALGTQSTTAGIYNLLSQRLNKKSSPPLSLELDEKFKSQLLERKKSLTFREKIFLSDLSLERDLAQSLSGSISYAHVLGGSVNLSKDRPSQTLASTPGATPDKHNSALYTASLANCEEIRKTIRQSGEKGNLLNLEFKIKVDSVIINYLSFVKLIQHTPNLVLDENMYFLKKSLTQYLNEACIFYDNSVSKYNIMVEGKNSQFKKLLHTNNIENLEEYRDNLDKKAISLISSLEAQLEIVKTNVLNDLATSGLNDLERLNIELNNRYNTSTIQSVPLKEKIDNKRLPSIEPDSSLTDAPKNSNVLKMGAK